LITFGSGTTVAVAHKLKRKWIGIELASYFETDILFRMKQVLAGSGKNEPTGISKILIGQGGGFLSITNLSNMRKRWQIVNMKMVICLMRRAGARIRNMSL